LPVGVWGYGRSAGGLYTTLSGTETRLETGWGAEVALTRHAGPFDWQTARFAWSHHEGEPGWPAAEYLRLGTALGISLNDETMGFVFLGGLAYNQLFVDGPGDVGGPGLTLEWEFFFTARERIRISLGCTAEGWVSWEGDLIGSLSPYIRFGVKF